MGGSRRSWLARLVGLGLLLATVLLPALVRASSLDSLVVLPDPLVLDPGTAATTWSGAIRLQSGRHLAVALLPQALIRISTDADASLSPSATVPPIGTVCSGLAGCVDAAAVKVEPATLTLDPNIPAEAIVTVTGPLPAGVYDGELDLVSVPVPEASAAPASPRIPDQDRIRVRVVARTSPALTLPAGTTALSARRVRLDNPADEILAWLFLTEAERSDQLIVPGTNDSRDPILVAIEFDAVGQASGRPFPSGSITWSTNLDPARACAPESKLSLPGQRAPAFKACLSKSTIAPDRYVGSVYLEGSAGAPAQAIPLDLTIKQGPGLPFLMILSGIALSWVAKWLIDRAFPAAALLDDLRKLERRIDAVPAEDQQPLRALALRVRTSIDADDQEMAKADLKQATTAVEVTEGLVAFEVDHGSAFKAERDHVRALLRAALVDEAATALLALRRAAVPTEPAATAGAEEAVRRGAPRGLPRRARASSSAVYAILVTIGVVLAVLALRTLPVVVVVVLAATLVALLAVIPGRRQIGSYVRHHWVSGAAAARPFVRLLIGLGLAIVGLETLYVANGTQLIAAPIDPLVVFTFWGLGSDVASRTIINFAKPG